jgi:hypothetical protein
MAELGLPMSEVTQDHMQNLMSQEYMITAKLTTCRVPEDPASPILVGGYVVTCTTFYARRFCVPSHQFLHSLLQFYGLELQHWTPSGIVHMAAFVTLCEAYMGIEPHFNLCNYFRVRLQQGSGGKVDIFVRSRHGVDPYFHLPMFGPSDRWLKVSCGSKEPSQAATPVGGRLKISTRRADGCGAPADLFLAAGFNHFVGKR